MRCSILGVSCYFKWIIHNRNIRLLKLHEQILLKNIKLPTIIVNVCNHYCINDVLLFVTIVTGLRTLAPLSPLRKLPARCAGSRLRRRSGSIGHVTMLAVVTVVARARVGVDHVHARAVVAGRGRAFYDLT